MFELNKFKIYEDFDFYLNQPEFNDDLIESLIRFYSITSDL